MRALLTLEEYNKPYDNPHSFGKTYGEHREYLEFNAKEYAELKRFADSIGMIFFASPWDIASADLLNHLQMPLFKISSACITNLSLLELVAGFGKPTIISAGMSNLDEIERAVKVFENAVTEYALLQCTSAYPCDFDDVNLNVIADFKRRFNCPIGFSGHHKGIAVDVGAVALGARIIERHFTLDRTMKGTDHAASLEPQGLHRLVRDVRAVEKAMGSATKMLLQCEIENRNKLRKAA